jgi:hypothetical protein
MKNLLEEGNLLLVESFVWRILAKHEALDIFNAGISVFELMDDGSEALIETLDYFKAVEDAGGTFGLEVGHLSSSSYHHAVITGMGMDDNEVHAQWFVITPLYKGCDDPEVIESVRKNLYRTYSPFSYGETTVEFDFEI